MKSFTFSGNFENSAQCRQIYKEGASSNILSRRTEKTENKTEGARGDARRLLGVGVHAHEEPEGEAEEEAPAVADEDVALDPIRWPEFIRATSQCSNYDFLP